MVKGEIRRERTDTRRQRGDGKLLGSRNGYADRFATSEHRRARRALAVALQQEIEDVTPTDYLPVDLVRRTFYFRGETVIALVEV